MIKIDHVEKPDTVSKRQKPRVRLGDGTADMNEVEPSTEKYAPSNQSSTSTSDGDETDFPRPRSISVEGVSGRSSGAGKKRTSRDALLAPNREAKRLREAYCSDYHQLYNKTVRETVCRDSDQDEEAFDYGQLGFATWSSSEKGSFFKALQRKGKDDIRAISQAVGTKSEPEVQIYLHALREGISQPGIGNEKLKYRGSVDIPAALEIGTNCENALEAAADWLATKQDKHEQHLEKNRHGEYWRLDHDSLPAIGRLREEQIPNASAAQSKAELQNAASLLDLEEFLRLSIRIFMNPPTLETNWRSYAVEDERPSILCTAFIDLSNLVVTTTKRLVLSTLFLASSRIKAKALRPHDLSAIVKPEDVQAALQVVGMNADRTKYWIGLARRCRLLVHEDLRLSRLANSRLTYDQVEDYLEKLADSREGGVPLLTQEDIDQDVANGLENFSGENVDISSQLAESGSICESQQSEDDDAEDKLAEARDLKASHQEERQLRKMLNMKAVSRDHDVGKPSLEPELNHKLSSDVRDWRGLVSFRREWETFDKPIPNEVFASKHRSSTKQSTLSLELVTESMETPNGGPVVKEVPESSSVMLDEGGFSSGSSTSESVNESAVVPPLIETDDRMDEDG